MHLVGIGPFGALRDDLTLIPGQPHTAIPCLIGANPCEFGQWPHPPPSAILAHRTHVCDNGGHNMVSISLLEDDREQLALLYAWTEKVLGEHGVGSRIRAFATGAALLADSPTSDVDLYLLDIQIDAPGPDGMEVARAVRSQDPRAIIMFATSSVAYAVEGYSVHAFDYLVKPVNYRTFETKLLRAIQSLRREESPFITIRSNHPATVLASDICFVETARRKSVLHMSSGERHECYESLSGLQKRLPESTFFRCHASYLVNVAHVASVATDNIIVGTESVPLARNRRKAFLDFLTAYVGSEL